MTVFVARVSRLLFCYVRVVNHCVFFFSFRMAIDSTPIIFIHTLRMTFLAFDFILKDSPPTSDSAGVRGAKHYRITLLFSFKRMTKGRASRKNYSSGLIIIYSGRAVSRREENGLRAAALTNIYELEA